MSRFSSTTLLTWWILLVPCVLHGQAVSSGPPQTSASVSSQQADDRQGEPAPAPIPPNSPRISKQTRLEIIRDFETQLVYARTAFPMGTKGLRLQDQVITPSGQELQQALNLWGPAVKPGDPAHISFVQIKDDHIHFDINGGPVPRRKWYQHIEISGSGGPVTPASNDPQSNAHGSF